MPGLSTKADWRSALAQLPVKRVQAGSEWFTYRESGAGEPLVFLHGISSGSGSWVHQLTALATHARCVAWDAPGYGGTTALEAACPSAKDFVRALKSFMDALKIERALLAGHSLGAIMATAFAAAYPDRVSGMVLLNPASGYGSVAQGVAQAKLNARLEQLRELGVEGLARERSAALVSQQADTEAVELIRWNMAKLSSEGYTQAAKMLAGADLLADARKFAGPVLVACGSADDITPEEQSRKVAAAFPRGEYRTLPDLGHASYIEEPKMVNQLILEFMSCAE